MHFAVLIKVDAIFEGLFCIDMSEPLKSQPCVCQSRRGRDNSLEESGEKRWTELVQKQKTSFFSETSKQDLLINKCINARGNVL